jgi:hypothetical protein
MLVVRADGLVDPCIPTFAAKPPAAKGDCVLTLRPGESYKSE